MGYEVKKTEHAGPKKGNGAYWGPKQVAKKQSNKIRRRNAQRSIGEGLHDDEYTPPQTRRAIDAQLAEAMKGRTYGPFNTADEMIAHMKAGLKKK